MDYSKFYTPPKIAKLLIRELKIQQPESAIDICCGSCNLLSAAHSRWPNTRLMGVDIVDNPTCGVDFLQEDGRRYALMSPRQHMLVLANPPFGNMTSKGEFTELYGDIPFIYSTSRLEIEMLLANLKLLQTDGTLVVIMPSTFVETQRNQKIRSYFGANYHIQKIIRLSDDTFGAAKISSYALIIKKNIARQHYTRLCEVVNDQVQPIRVVPQRNIRNGVWVDSCDKQHTLIQFEVRRGTVSSQYFSKTGIPVLHTAKKLSKWVPSQRFVEQVPQNAVYAEDGDIIVSRIGKSAGKWCRYQGEKMMVSDCLIRIKDAQGGVYSRIKHKEYTYPLKGVATKYITVLDFQRWVSSLETEG